MKSYDVLKLLKELHNNDVFVSECKDGETYGRNHLRFDAVAIPRSFTHFKITGYEIKVSRSDFKQDDKFSLYLPLCNEFYFVCPFGMVDKSEIPVGCGLKWVTKNGDSITTRLKAPARKIDPPVELLKYIILYRSYIIENSYGKENVNFWKRWAENRADNFHYGKIASSKLREKYKKDVEETIKKYSEINSKYVDILERCEKIEPVEKWLKENRIPTYMGDGNAIIEHAKAIQSCIPNGLINSITTLQYQINELKKNLENYTQK